MRDRIDRDVGSAGGSTLLRDVNRWVRTGISPDLDASPADAAAFRDHNHRTAAREIHWLIALLILFNVGFWLTDAWVFRDHPEVIAPIGQARALLIVVALLLWPFHALFPERAYWTAVLAGSLVCFIMGYHLGLCGGPSTPWFHFLYPFMLALLFGALRPLERVAWTALFGGMILLGYFGLHPAWLADPLAAMTIAHFGYITFLCLFVGLYVDVARLRHFLTRRELEQTRDQLEARVADKTRALREFVAHLDVVQDGERARLARDLHDELGQLLAAQRLVLRAATGRYLAGQSSIEPNLRQLERLVDEVTSHFRGMLAELRPRAVDDLGLEAALEGLMVQVRERLQLPCVLTLPPGRLELTGLEAATAYRCVQEALTNVAKHARASVAAVDVGVEGHWLIAMVKDDGQGFDATTSTGFGLLGMRERLEALNGRLELESGPRRGTSVTIRIPMSIQGVA